MTPDALNPTEVLDEEECWNVLLGASLGRLALSVNNLPEIYPVNFLAHDGRILFATNPGDKLFGLTVNENVALEADGIGINSVWSVVVKGKARWLESAADIEAAETLHRKPMTAIRKRVFVEIIPTAITGRRIHRGVENDELTSDDLY
ncbi:pyridoxamine 5'-phosphate oxidase family protein [Arthrobacter sp. 35W]|uniref:pyridoxamine 5'-phosphate oxidase family protein n=1 Tax=Arthrobacter sp. 35W TaxID=1132441 RepID=UPI000478B464|nr:pyridoxamine 5'-phosphate oxidase family protein [Arthrobacter sp. 35W]